MAVSAGSSNLFFARNTKVFLEQNGTMWEIPVLDGYNYSQDTNTTEVTLSEMADSQGTSRRGRQVFTDSYAPSEWSFDTYARPFSKTVDSSNTMHAVEEALWANLVAENKFNNGSWSKAVTNGANSLDISFAESNKILLGTFNLYFVLGAATSTSYNYPASGDTTIYKVNNAVINEVSMNFEVDGIATLSWSGMGGLLEEVASLDASASIRDSVNNDSNMIRQKLTQLTASSAISGTMKDYNISLTGGSITITNNISFLTPELLGRVNQPLGHITGARSISGTFTAYLDEKTNSSIDLFDDISRATNVVTNKFALNFYIGGKGAGDIPRAPGIQFKVPQAHLSLPTFDVSDVFAVEVEFNALPSTVALTDEIEKISYVGIK